MTLLQNPYFNQFYRPFYIGGSVHKWELFGMTKYEIDARRQRQALVDAHGAAVLALKQEPNKPFVGGVYY